MTTMIGPLRRAATIAPQQVAVRCGQSQLTYGQTWERARRLAGALDGLGLGRGDRVAVAGRNCHRYLELYQAVPGAGMVIVPLNHRHTAAELGYALEDSGARALFASPEVGYPPDAVEHVVDLDDGYEALLADAAPAEFPGDIAADTVVAGGGPG